MKIRVWQKDYDLIDETILGPGDFTAVKPQLYHTFEAIEDGVAFELYWAEFRHNDISRENVGHLKTKDNVVRLDKKKKSCLTSITYLRITTQMSMQKNLLQRCVSF